MKKLLLLLTILLGALTAQADGYSYLTFVTTDGTKTSVPSSSLSITLSGTTLTAGSNTFTLSNLSKMYFTTTDESSTTAINSVDAAEGQPVEVTTIDGRHVGTYSTVAEATASLPKGIYVIRSKTASAIKLKIENRK